MICSLEAQYNSCISQGKVFFAYSQNTPMFTNESRLLRVVHRFFYGYSFDLARNTQQLIAQFPSVSDDLSDTEERSALKVLGVVSQLLNHSIRNKSPKTHSKERAALFAKIDQMADHLSKRMGTSKIKILLECCCQDNAYVFAQNKNLDPHIPTSDLEPLLQMACEKGDVDTVCFLLNRGVSSAHVQKVPPSYFLTLALAIADRFDDKALSSLIREHLSVHSEGSLYVKAASCGLLDSVKAFIAAGKVSPRYTDEEKNTALHHAFASGNIPLIQFLFNHIDPTLQNKKNNTALQEFLSDHNSLDCQIADLDAADFLENLLKRPKDLFQGVVPKNKTVDIRGIQKSLPVDYLELFFLNNTPLADSTFRITREDLDASYSFLSKKYPCGMRSVDAFCMQAFSLNEDHLKTGCTQTEIPPKVPNDVHINTLQTLFDGIDWGKEDLPKIYQDVFEKPLGLFENPRDALQEPLNLIFSRIATKEYFLGTPRKSTDRNDFYSKIELALRHCCAKLDELHNNKLIITFIKEILRASKYCGGRWFQTAINQYLLVCKELVTTPRGFFEQQLADYRRMCFEGVVAELTQGDVHGLTHASADLGEELGIPGTHTKFKDIYTTTLYNRETIRKSFFENSYTPYSIVFDHCFPLLSQDSEASNSYIDLHKEIIPPWWNKEKYQAIQKELRAIPSSFALEAKTEAENKILEKYDILRTPKMTAQQAVEEDRIADYLERFVYDENGKRSFFGLIYALERLGILCCSLPYKDKSKKVEPLPRQEAYRKISLWGFISSIGSFFKGFLF